MSPVQGGVVFYFLYFLFSFGVGTFLFGSLQRIQLRGKQSGVWLACLISECLCGGVFVAVFCWLAFVSAHNPALSAGDVAFSASSYLYIPFFRFSSFEYILIYFTIITLSPQTVFTLFLTDFILFYFISFHLLSSYFTYFTYFTYFIYLSICLFGWHGSRAGGGGRNWQQHEVWERQVNTQNN